MRDLYIETDYTERFTNLFDDNYKFSDEEKILYINSGAGNHALAVREKLDDVIEIFGVSENRELLTIARAKADAIQANVDFSTVFPSQKYDAVMTDAMLVKPAEANDLLAKAVGFSNKQVAFFLPTAGSFGDIFSFLWETFFNLDMLDKSAEVERLITDLPTISAIEEAAAKLGLTKIETMSKTEFFEYDNGAAFIAAPLLEDFLFPLWLDFLSADEAGRVKDKLAQIIDADVQEMNFSFAVKATLLVGEKP